MTKTLYPQKFPFMKSCSMGITLPTKSTQKRNYRSYLKNEGELAERVLVKKRHRTTLTVLPVLLLQSEAGPKTETVIFYFKSQVKA